MAPIFWNPPEAGWGGGVLDFGFAVNALQRNIHLRFISAAMDLPERILLKCKASPYTP